MFSVTRLIGTFEADIGAVWAILSFYSGFRTPLPCFGSSFVEKQALHIVSEIGEHDLGLDSFGADGADK